MRIDTTAEWNKYLRRSGDLKHLTPGTFVAEASNWSLAKEDCLPTVMHRIRTDLVRSMEQVKRYSSTSEKQQDIAAIAEWKPLAIEHASSDLLTRIALFSLRAQNRLLDRTLYLTRQRDRIVQRTHALLDEIANLPDDWDSYGASRPTAVAVSAAYRLVDIVRAGLDASVGENAMPWMIAPLADGGLQLEWHGSNRAVEIEVGPDGVLGYLVEQGGETTVGSQSRGDCSEKEILRQIRWAISG